MGQLRGAVNVGVLFPSQWYWKRREELSSSAYVGEHVQVGLLAPTTPEAAEYDVIVKKMKEHTNPKPSTVVQRFRFNTRWESQ